EQLRRQRIPLCGAESEVRAVKSEDLARRQPEVEVWALRHNADRAFHGHALARYVVRANPSFPARGVHARGEPTDSGGFSSAVGDEQAEDFAGLDFERQ